MLRQSIESRPAPGPCAARCRPRRLFCVAEAPSSSRVNAAPAAHSAAAAPAAAPPAAGNGVAAAKRPWVQKSALDILRSDGMSCSREHVEPCGSLKFTAPSSQQQLLVWKTRPKTVMVLKKLGDELYGEFLEVVRYLGEDLGLTVVVEPDQLATLRQREPGLDYCTTWEPEVLPDMHSFVDFIVCLGGDGLLLHAATLLGSAMPPVISFKLGSLGFLTAHRYDNFRQDLEDVVSGCSELDSCRVWDSLDGSVKKGVRITLRMRLECELLREGQPARSFEVLNEVVLSRGANPYLSNIEVFESGQFITKVQADGVMLATPTGSTAYNVAAGGSMVHPSVPAILFTPICPHSLNFRPIILPDYSELELRIAPAARCGATVTFDGRDMQEMGPGDRLRVRMSPNPVPTIQAEDGTTDWFGAIQRCFQWSERVEQKAMAEAPRLPQSQ